jgi:hypothetical protein
MSETIPTKPNPHSTQIIENHELQVSYINVVRIIHSSTEFLFDFSHILPGDNQAKIQSRVIMSPISAKLFLRALIENISKYENVHGEISLPGDFL